MLTGDPRGFWKLQVKTETEHVRILTRWEFWELICRILWPLVQTCFSNIWTGACLFHFYILYIKMFSHFYLKLSCSLTNVQGDVLTYLLFQNAPKRSSWCSFRTAGKPFVNQTLLPLFLQSRHVGVTLAICHLVQKFCKNKNKNVFSL